MEKIQNENAFGWIGIYSATVPYFIEKSTGMVTSFDENGFVNRIQKHFYPKRPQLRYYATNLMAQSNSLDTLRKQTGPLENKSEGEMN